MKNESASLLHDALDHLHMALELLDRAAAPPNIGAHVDLALHQLEAIVPDHSEDARLTPIRQGVARH